MNKTPIKLGNKARSIVSGFTGIAVARVEYLNGCVQIALRAKVCKDGKESDANYYDVKEVEFVSNGVAITPELTGGPQRDAPK